MRVFDGRDVEVAHHFLLATQAIQADAITDGEQPRAETKFSFEGVERGESLQESVLADLFGVVVIAHHPINEGEETILVKIDQFTDGAAIAALGFENKPLFRFPSLLLFRWIHARTYLPTLHYTVKTGVCCVTTFPLYNRLGKARNIQPNTCLS